MPNITYGMILIFGDSAMIKLYASASQTPRSSRSSNFIMQHLEAGIMDQLGQPEKFLIAEVITTKTNDAKVVVDLLKSNIFCRFGVLKALASDQGSHFYNRAMITLLHKYRVVHRVFTAYHP
ncbi:hypothetical protein CR513_10358, partial [Mucuna pruriens]